MHHSRLAAGSSVRADVLMATRLEGQGRSRVRHVDIIDCRDTAPDDAARFWSTALGMPSKGDDGHGYAELESASRDLHIEVQNVTHESRLHLDLETDDEAAEVARLEQLGAKQVGKGPRWTVMEAPTGQRFCVVRCRRPMADLPGVNRWG